MYQSEILLKMAMNISIHTVVMEFHIVLAELNELHDTG